jgi:molybdopterin converting factor small subunit
MRLLQVRIEAFSYLADAFGSRRSERLVLDRVVAPGTTVEGLVRQLATEYPGFAHLCLHGEEIMAEGYAVVVADQVLELAGGWQRPLHDGDEILLLPAFSGG